MFYIKMPCLVIRDGGFHLLGHSWRGDALAVVSALTGNVHSTATAGLLSVSVSGCQASLTRCCAMNENGTWSSICISHNEVLKIHRDTSNEPGTLNYTVTLGDFQGGGLLLESPTGAKTIYVDALQKQLLFSVVNTKEAPLAFDGNLWHGIEPFTGNRWVITAYTCKLLATFKKEDISALLNWGYPLPGTDATIATQSRPTLPIPPPPLPSKFCLVICSSRTNEIQAAFLHLVCHMFLWSVWRTIPSIVKFFEVRQKGFFSRSSLYIPQTGRWYMPVGCSSSAKWLSLLVLLYILIFRIGLPVGPISFFCTVWLQV